MSLFKRKDSPFWWVKFSCKGIRVQRSSGTADRIKAQEYHDRLKAELWEQQRLGVKPRYTWNEAVVRWLNETTYKRSQKDDKGHLRWLDPYLNGIALSEIDRTRIDKLKQSRQDTGVSAATVNRMLEVVRAILRKAAFEWEWIDRVPKVRLLKEPKRRVRFLTQDEALRLLLELPEHLARIARFSLLTGLRKSNVLNLQFSQLELSKRRLWIPADQAKGGKAIAVPLVPEAAMILADQFGRSPGCNYVFTFGGERIKEVNTKAFRAALKRAGIADFRWHDLRHTWASWHVQNGTPQHVLQELGAWESAEMVRRYAHLSVDHLTSYADAFASKVRLSEEAPRVGGYDSATAGATAHA